MTSGRGVVLWGALSIRLTTKDVATATLFAWYIRRSTTVTIGVFIICTWRETSLTIIIHSGSLLARCWVVTTIARVRMAEAWDAGSSSATSHLCDWVTVLSRDWCCGFHTVMFHTIWSGWARIRSVRMHCLKESQHMREEVLRSTLFTTPNGLIYFYLKRGWDRLSNS